jgi:hypothetical protein
VEKAVLGMSQGQILIWWYPKMKIDLGENFGSSQLIKKNIDLGKRIFVFDGHCIERSVVNTQPQTTIFPLDKKCGTTPRRRTWENVALI